MTSTSTRAPAGEAAPRARSVAEGVDAEAIRLAAKVEEAQAAILSALWPPPRSREEEQARAPEQDRLADLRDSAVAALMDTPARTLAGFIAKARAAYALAEKDRDGELVAPDLNDLLPLALVEELARLGGPLPPPHPSELPPSDAAA